MSRDRAEDVPTSPAEVRRRVPGLQTMLTLAAACAALFWVARTTRDALEPANYLVRMLRNGDAEQRIEAAKGLGEDEAGPTFRPKAAEALIAALADPNVDVAADAARSLASLIHAEADADLARSWADSLAIGLRDPRAEVRKWTAASFSYFVPPQSGRRSWVASDALAALVSDPDEEIPLVAIAALGTSGTGEAGALTLTKALTGDARPSVRVAAARALASYPDRRDDAARALLHGLKSGLPEIREASHLALEGSRYQGDRPGPSAALVPDLIAAAADPDRMTRAHVAILLREIGPAAVAAVPALVAMIAEADAGPDEADPRPVLEPPPALAAEALGRIAPGTPREREAAEALDAVLGEPREPGTLDVAAALALARFGSAEAARALPRLLSILEAGLRAHEDGRRLATRQDAEAFSSRVRDAGRAAEALGLVAPGTPREADVVAALVRVMDSPMIELHAQAAEALGRFGPLAKAALPRLRAMARIEDPWRRRVAREAVRLIETPSPDAPTEGRERPPGA